VISTLPAANQRRFAASATQVPFFALFEFIASQLSHASQANNAKDGTILAAN
jgi:hypothetical protein